jgi:hypothetical protein
LRLQLGLPLGQPPGLLLEQLLGLLLGQLFAVLRLFHREVLPEMESPVYGEY